jgi:hypothetical protein
MIIHLIATPRNISTGIMYSFAQRPDMRVIDEPWYAYWLKQTGADHPGREATLQSMPHTHAQVMQGIREAESQKPHLFLKNMAKHLDGLPTDFMAEFKNLFLIRDPHKLIASFAEVIPNPPESEIGLVGQYALFSQCLDRGEKPLVLDSGELLANPSGVLQGVCTALGLPWEPAMLQWEAGPRPEDGVWAPYWYANVHQSTGFAPQASSARPLPPNCLPLYEQLAPLYQEMKKMAITAVTE